ncbi:MAG: type II toxin-antitoxin system VapC family toxin [Myxococcaceae bacterium]|nr:type II toxin-antitoxin system VapC family toxin [Myxococcaceae bacterium]
MEEPACGPSPMTLRRMLDTDTCSFLLRGDSEVVARLQVLPRSTICISAVSVGELRIGATLKGSKRLHAQIDRLVDTILVAPFDNVAACELGQVGASLLRRGVDIGQYDAQLAAHAISLGVILVTHNERHFSRVRELRLEDWR